MQVIRDWPSGMSDRSIFDYENMSLLIVLFSLIQGEQLEVKRERMGSEFCLTAWEACIFGVGSRNNNAVPPEIGL